MNLPAKILLLGIWLVCVVSPCLAVQPYTPTHPDPVLEPWRWRFFPELKGKGLFCLTEAADGAMWFGLDSGVERYDGINWTPYTRDDGIYGAPVRALQATRDGSVYAGTELGLSRFRDGKWKRVFPDSDVHPWPIYNLTETADGSLWAATAWGALHISPTDTTLYTSKDTAPAVRVVAPGLALSIIPAPVRPWPEGIGIAVTAGHGTLVTGNEPWVVTGFAEGSPGQAAGLVLGDHIVAVNGQPIPIDLNGAKGTSVRLTVQRRGLSDAIEFTVARLELSGGFRHSDVFDVFEDGQRRIWIGLYQGELIVSAPDSKSGWRLFTAADGLEPGAEPRISQSLDGTVWAISNSSSDGMNRFDGSRWSTVWLDAPQWFPVHSSILGTKDGTQWVAGMTLQTYRDGKWRFYMSDELPIPYHRKRMLEASDGAIYNY